MAALSICKKHLINKLLERNARLSYRLISTSGEKKDTNEPCPPPESVYKKPIDFSKPLESKNWMSYGYSKTNKEEDRFQFHMAMFSAVTVALGGFIFVLLYYPDIKRNNWAQREAFIRLYEREQLGLDPISPNYVDPSKIILPPDEEIGEDDIII